MRICHVVYGYFPFDPRVRREVEALERMGHEVHVIAMTERGERREEMVFGVNVHRILWPVIRGGRVRYAFQYAVFFLAGLVRLLEIHLERPFRIIHIHSLPDFLVFMALPERALGARIILDLHEAMPEIFAARFPNSAHGFFGAVARALEFLSCTIANRVLVVNDAIRDRVSTRGVNPGKIEVVMNSPDPERLEAKNPEALRKALGLEGKRGIVYVGGVNAERDLTLLIKAAARLRKKFALRVVIFGYGEAGYRELLRRVAREEGIDADLVLGGRLPAEDVFSYISLSELGLITYVRNPLTELALPNKVFEYAAARKPLVIADLPALRALFTGSAVFYRPGDLDDLVFQIESLLTNEGLKHTLAEQANRVMDACGWPVMKNRLLSVYNSLAPIVASEATL